MWESVLSLVSILPNEREREGGREHVKERARRERGREREKRGLEGEREREKGVWM